MRKCSNCKVEKPLTEFNKNKANKSGVSSYCKLCLKIHKAKYYERNKSIILAKAKQAHLKSPEKSRKRSADWRLKNPNKVAQNRLKKYGIDLETKNKMLQQQNNCCAICNNKIKGQINIDHCHATGKVREILCSPCNFLLGNCNDNPNILKNAIDYLEKYNGN